MRESGGPRRSRHAPGAGTTRRQSAPGRGAAEGPARWRPAPAGSRPQRDPCRAGSCATRRGTSSRCRRQAARRPPDRRAGPASRARYPRFSAGVRRRSLTGALKRYGQPISRWPSILRATRPAGDGVGGSSRAAEARSGVAGHPGVARGASDRTMAWHAARGGRATGSGRGGRPGDVDDVAGGRRPRLGRGRRGRGARVHGEPGKRRPEHGRRLDRCAASQQAEAGALRRARRQARHSRPADGNQPPSALLRDNLRIVYTGSLDLVVDDLQAALAQARAAVAGDRRLHRGVGRDQRRRRGRRDDHLPDPGLALGGRGGGPPRAGDAGRQ